VLDAHVAVCDEIVEVLDAKTTMGQIAFESTANRFVAFIASLDANVVVFDAQVAQFDEYLTMGQMAFESTAKRLVAFTASFDANVAVDAVALRLELVNVDALITRLDDRADDVQGVRRRRGADAH